MKTVKNLEKMGRQAWLAGLGIYGTGWKFALDKLDQAYVDTNATVNELISRGKDVQDNLEGKLANHELLDQKVTALKLKLGLSDTQDTQRLDLLSTKVDALTEAVTKLVAIRQAKATPTVTPVKTKTKSVKTKPSKATTVKTPAKVKKSTTISKATIQPKAE